MFEVASATARGGRDHMEDFVRIEAPFLGRADSLFAAVFDGHGGEAVARRAAQELPSRVAVGLGAGEPIDAALRAAFREFDDSVSEEPCGSTAAVLVLSPGSVSVANAGDSHILLVTQLDSEVLTVDHRLTNEREYARVVAAGAQIRGGYACLPDGRGLMCTRSLGDREFRRVGIISEPAVSSLSLAAEDEWLVIGSDGVWDGLDADEVAGLARSAPTARSAAERIRDAALAANTDNVSAVAVRIP